MGPFQFSKVPNHRISYGENAASTAVKQEFLCWSTEDAELENPSAFKQV